MHSLPDLVHPFEPVWDQHSRILILGSFPSVLSRENGFYYGNPRNRFWQILSGVYGQEVPLAPEGKVDYLLQRGLALWDALASCEIRGSADSQIRNAQANDVGLLLSKAPIHRIVANGQLAGKIIHAMNLAIPSEQIIVLPSTSPANATWSLHRLVEVWGKGLAQAETP